MENVDYTLCECELDVLKKFVTELEGDFNIQIAKVPSICLTMIKAEDSMEHQPFYLGEALTTECEVIINEAIGYGICLGDEPVRSYCIAVIDALLKRPNGPISKIQKFVDDNYSIIQYNNKVEHNQILKTKVDFKLMEQD
jgi:phosphonate C-P lyase system protein PhnG